MKTNISLRKLSPGILSCVLISLSDITLVLAVPPPPPPPPVYVANTPDHSVPVAAQSIIEYRYVGVTEGSSEL
jgi:hypothetical protein